MFFAGPIGEQFNDQQSIWLGHSPTMQGTNANINNDNNSADSQAFRGVLTGKECGGVGEKLILLTRKR